MTHHSRLFGPKHDPAEVEAALTAAGPGAEPGATRTPKLVILTPQRDTEGAREGMRSVAATLAYLSYAEQVGETPAEAVRALAKQMGMVTAVEATEGPGPKPDYDVVLVDPEAWRWDWASETAQPLSPGPWDGRDPLSGATVVIDPLCPEPVGREGMVWDHGVVVRPAHPVKRASAARGEIPEHGVARDRREHVLDARRTAQEAARVLEAQFDARGHAGNGLGQDLVLMEHALGAAASQAQVQDPRVLRRRVEQGYCPTEMESEALFALWKHDVVAAERDTELEARRHHGQS